MNENSIRPTDEHEARLVKQLRTLAGVLQPRPDFAARLEADLLARWKLLSTPVAPRRTINPTNPRRQPMLKRLSFALAAVAAALVLALVLSPLFGGDHDLPPLPRLVYASGPGSQPALEACCVVPT